METQTHIYLLIQPGRMDQRKTGIGLLALAVVALATGVALVLVQDSTLVSIVAVLLVVLSLVAVMPAMNFIMESMDGSAEGAGPPEEPASK